MPWWFAVVERDHEIQNPMSAEKIRLLGRSLRLGPDSSVLDVGCGKAGPAVILARDFGCRITGIERAPEFVADARERIAAEGLADRIEIVERDASDFVPEPGRYDVVLSLGTSFIWGDLDRMLAVLSPAARSGGHVVVGEVYLRGPVEHDGYEAFVPLPDTVARFAAAGLSVEGFIDASPDDWDAYESLHWRALNEWLAANPDDPEAEAFTRRNEANRAEYFEWSRDALGWAILVARKPQAAV